LLLLLHVVVVVVFCNFGTGEYTSLAFGLFAKITNLGIIGPAGIGRSSRSSATFVAA